MGFQRLLTCSNGLLAAQIFEKCAAQVVDELKHLECRSQAWCVILMHDQNTFAHNPM